MYKAKVRGKQFKKMCYILLTKRTERHGTDLKIFLARTSRTSHFKSILSLEDDSLLLRGKFPLSDNLPFLFTLLSIELIHNLLDTT